MGGSLLRQIIEGVPGAWRAYCFDAFK